MRINNISTVGNKGIIAYTNTMQRKEKENQIGSFIDNFGITNNKDKSVRGYGKNMKLSGEDQRESQAVEEENIQKLVKDAIGNLNEIMGQDEYDRLSELGIVADKDELGTIVTVYDRIQIELAAYGDGDINGLGISQDKIEKVLSSKGMAEAVKKAESIGEIDDTEKEYILKNELEPTVGNIYKASYSCDGTGEKQSAMTDEEWKQLEQQIEKIFEKNGMDISNENMEAAKWLVEKEIPVTVDNILKLEKLNEIEALEKRNYDNIKTNMAIAKIFGKSYEDGYMTSGMIDGDAAREAVETIENADYETVDYIAKNNLTLNVENLKRYKEIAEHRTLQEKNENHTDDQDEETKNRQEKNRKVLLEAKTLLTVAAALTMQKMGVNITYEDLENVVETVKNEEKKYYDVYFENPDEEKTNALIDVMNNMALIPGMPAAVLGQSGVKEEFTINNVVREGTALKESYSRAMITYEAVGTNVRTDLGDDIKTAFRNIDELLTQADVAVNDDTRKAARILGYNSMEITKENIYFIAEKVSELNRVIKNITPKTAAYLIENGINPLDENIESLNDRLEVINEELGGELNEEYSKYLWKLEKSGKFTGEKREAYIELYRTLKLIQKMDTRSLGAVVGTGAEITLASLLSAERSRSRYNMDVEIDETTGFFEGRYTKNKLKDILENITNNDVLIETKQLEYMSPEKLAEAFLNMENEALSRELEYEYSKEQLARNQVESITEEMFMYMLDGGTGITMENIYASSLMTNSKVFGQLFNKNGEAEKKILEHFDSEEDVADALNNLLGKAAEQLNATDSQSKEYPDNRNIYNVARFMVQSAKNKCYDIPMQIGDNQIFVKVKFSHSEGNRPTIAIDMDEEVLGRLSAHFEINNNEISGNIMCEKDETRQIVNRNVEELNTLMEKQLNVYVVTGQRKENINKEFKSDKEYTDKELYNVAKTFLKSIKKWAGNAEVMV